MRKLVTEQSSFQARGLRYLVGILLAPIAALVGYFVITWPALLVWAIQELFLG